MPNIDSEEYEVLLQFLYMAPIGLAQIRASGEISMLNPLCAQLLMPLSKDGSLDNLFVALENIAPDLQHRVNAFPNVSGNICDAMHLHINSSLSGKIEMRVLSLNLLKLTEDRLMAVISDVTQSVKRESELRQSQAWIHTLITGVDDYAWVKLSAGGICLEWNPSIERLTGLTNVATQGAVYSIFFPHSSFNAMGAKDRLNEADRVGWSLDEGWCLRADGSRYWGSCLIAPMHEAGCPAESEHAYCLIIRDISERRELNDSLRRSLHTDHLTNIFNRRALFEAATTELQRWRHSSHSLSVVMIDADHFKQVNDRYGHAAGDAVLRHLATALVAAFSSHHTVARLGGEEFVALLPGINQNDATEITRRICQNIELQSVRVGGHVIRYTISAGVSAMENSVGSFDELLQRADAAMYIAKSNGRNQVAIWEPSVSMTLENESPSRHSQLSFPRHGN
jgi:diguanylate cyclase (GGDEF)-like protein/PAS domain S-box-containing protein